MTSFLLLWVEKEENKLSRLVYNLFNTKIIFVVKKELLIMYEVNVMIYGPDGENLGYKR